MSRPNRTALRAALLLASSLAVAPGRADAQTPGWFVPKGSDAGAASQAAPARHVRHAPAAQAPAPAPEPEQVADQSQVPNGPPPALPLPPVPPMGTLPKGSAPPTAVIGVISVPDIMRSSSAAAQVQKVLGARRDKLQADVQKEQMVWRDIQGSLQDSKTMSAEQIRGRERALQERVLAAQRDFKNRQRVIQEAAQVALGQIERELVQVIREVAASKGMNLVLHQEQVALNVQGFDITQQVASQLNAVLPSVFIPADGVDPEQLAKSGSFPTTADAGGMAGGAQQASASAPASAPAPARK